MRRRSKARARAKRPALVEELEQRLLFSADVAPALAPDDAGPAEATVLEAPLEPATSESAPSATAAETRHEIVFVDSSVPEAQQLLDDLLAQSGADRHFDVVVLDPESDGVAQISRALAGYDGALDAVHVVSHGADGSVQLGNSWLSRATLDLQAEAIAGWGSALGAEADLLFYGCDLAAGAEGVSLVESLAALTGADVAASTDDTGHWLFGADWELEQATGEIETGLAFSAELQQSWGHVMAVGVDFTSTGQAETGNLSISHTTSGTDRLMLVGVAMEPDGLSVSGITYNGDALTRAGFHDGGGDTRLEIWFLVAPQTGTANVLVTFSGSDHDGAAAGVMTFTGVDQTTPLGTFAGANGSSASASVNVSSSAGELVFGTVMSHTGSGVGPGGGQTEHWDVNTTETNSGGTTEAGAASVTTSWTVNNAQWAAAGVSIRPSGDTSPPSLVNNNPSTVSEGGTDTITSGELQFSDAEPAANIQYTVTAGPSDGQLELTTLPFSAITSFTQDDLDNNRVIFRHDGSEPAAISFDFDVDDGLGNASTGHTFNLTVTPVNDDPTLGGTVAGQAVTDKTTVDPFTGVTIGDVDTPAQTLTVDVQLDLAAKGALTNLSGFSDLGGGLYRFSGTAAAATTAIRALTFDPAENRVAPASTETTTFTISVDDGIAAPTVDATTTVISTSVNDASSVGGTVAGQAVTDKTTVDPFSGVTIGDVDNPAQTLTVDVQLDLAAKGALTNLSGFTDLGGGLYRFSGTATAATTAIRALTFDPAENRVAPASTETTTFTISVDDGIAAPTVDATTTVISTSVNDASTLGGTVAGQAVTDKTTVDPFTGVSIGDVDNPAQTLTVDVQLDLAAKGALTNLSGFTDLGGGLYRFSGTAAAATTAIQALTFDPAENRVTPGSTETTTFTISVDDGIAAPTVDATTTVISTSVNDASTLGGTVAGQAVTDKTTVDPFSAVTIGDVDNPAQTLTVDVQLDLAAKGVLTNLSGFTDLGGGLYRFSGTAAAATTAIQALTFDPAENRVTPGSTETTTFTISVDDSIAAPTVDATTTVISTSVNDASTLGGSVAGQAVTDKTTVDPFSGVTIGDIDNPAQTLTVDVQLDLAAKGALTNLSGFTDLGGGLYRFSGTATAATTATRALTFDPAENRVAPGSTETTFFTISVDDGIAAPTVDATTTVISTSVNDSPSLNNGGLAAVPESTPNPPGDSVANIFAGQFGDVDASSSFAGIAMVGNAANPGTEGTWQYSTNAGTNWFAIGSVNDGLNALAIDAATLVRFVPVPGYNGSPTALVVRALDDTYAGAFSTTAGSETRETVDTSSPGASTPISDPTAELQTSITFINDPPTISGSVAGQAVNDKATVDPFTGVTIGDVDAPAQTLTVDVQLDLAAKGTLTNLSGFTDLGGGLYRFSGTAAAATTAIQALTFDPAENRVTPGSTETTTFTISVDDGIAAPTVDAATTVISTSVNDASTVGGTVASQAVTDKTTVDPFSGVTIGDVDNPAQNLTVDVQLDLAAKGVLTNLSGFTDLGGGLYRFSGTAAAATTAIQALTFDPTENRVAPGSTETTTFTISVDDGIAAPTGDAATTVISTSVNDASTVGGTVAGQAVSDKTTVDPFSGVTIGDLDSPAQTLTVDVQLDLAAKGVLTNLSGFSDLGGGLYRFSGTAAAATTALQALTFDPAENRVTPGSTETTTFTISVDDGIAAPTVDMTTTVISTSVNDASTVGGTVAGQAVTDKTTVDPFSAVTIGDLDNPAQTLTVDVQLDLAAKGTLTNLSGFTDLGGGVYRFSGTAAAATTAIQALTFDPAENRVTPGSTETTTFTISVDDGIAAPTVDMTTTVISTSVNDASTVGGTVAGQAVTDKTTVDPFSAVTIGDLDNPAQTLTVDVQLDVAAKGALTNLSGFTDLGGGLYRFSGTAAAATTAIQALTFDPAENRVTPGSTETTTFTISVDDGIAAPTVDAATTVISTSVNDASTLGGSVAGQAVTDKTTVDPFSGVTIGDIDNPAQTLTVDVQLDVAAKGTLTNLSGFTDLGGGLYRFSGTATAATTAIQALTFDPAENRVAPGLTETTTFTISVDDGVAAPTVDATTTVISTSVNDASTVAGAVAGQAVTDKGTVDPFSAVTIGDVDNPAQTLTVDVQLDLAAKGALTNLSGFTDLGGGLYRFSGTAAATTTAIRALTFDPTENRVAPGLTETTTFTITVDDGMAAPTVDATTTVFSTSINDAPSLSGTVAGQIVTDKATVDPFTVVNLTEPDVGQTMTVDVQLDLAAKGVLTNLGGFTHLGGGLYRFMGTPALAMTALQGLSFDPAENRVAPGLTETTSFTITVDDGIAAPALDATTSVISTSINDAPGVTNKTFSVPSSSPNGSVVGSVPASDPDASESLIWTITGGNTGGAFLIDPASGQIRVADASALGSGPFTLSVRVDDANGAFGTATVSVGVSGTPTDPDPDPITVVPPPTPDPVPAPEPVEPPEPAEEPTLEVETETPEVIPAALPAPSAESRDRFVDLDTLPQASARTLSMALASAEEERTPPVSAPAPEAALAARPEPAALVIDDAMWRALDARTTR